MKVRDGRLNLRIFPVYGKWNSHIYEVEEDSINGYESHINRMQKNGFEVVNRYTGKNPEEDPVNILVTKDLGGCR